jgi:glucose uptake protein GlcU
MHRKRLKFMSALQGNEDNPEARTYFGALATAFIVLGILLCGCHMASDERNNPRTTKKGITVAQTPKSTLSMASMPPIDAVAYARIETATFALG